MGGRRGKKCLYVLQLRPKLLCVHFSDDHKALISPVWKRRPSATALTTTTDSLVGREKAKEQMLLTPEQVCWKEAREALLHTYTVLRKDICSQWWTNRRTDGRLVVVAPTAIRKTNVGILTRLLLLPAGSAKSFCLLLFFQSVSLYFRESSMYEIVFINFLGSHMYQHFASIDFRN